MSIKKYGSKKLEVLLKSCYNLSDNNMQGGRTMLETIGIFFPFILAAILKSAQGTSTVALTTTAGIVAPILPVLGLDSPIRATLAVMTTLVLGISGMLEIFILSLFLH